jgi:CubicO group peptidase (beta-lactamase class C family)
MRLVESGKIDLDRSVDTYLNRWHLPRSTFENSDVTVRRLLSHTAGISRHDYHGWDPKQSLPKIDDSLSGKTGTGEVRVVAAPGTEFSYSGAGYAILQLLIEEVSGQTFQDYMRKQVLHPLGMKNSEYGWPPRDEKTAATPYDVFGKPVPSLRYNELAAAGLATNLEDLAAFAVSGLKSPADEPAGRGLFKPETVALMQTPAPASPQYGLGYTVRPDQFAGKVAAGHGGSNRGWESFFQTVPSTGDGIVILTNGSNGGAVISSILCSWWRWGAGHDEGVECPKIDVRAALYGIYQARGLKDTIARYRELRLPGASKYDFSAIQLNSMGYELLRRDAVRDAIEIFRLNVEQFPREWNVYDSLGEALLKNGDKERAIENYKKSIELNPQNGNGRGVLKSLGVTLP